MSILHQCCCHILCNVSLPLPYNCDQFFTTSLNVWWYNLLPGFSSGRPKTHLGVVTRFWITARWNPRSSLGHIPGIPNHLWIQSQFLEQTDNSQLVPLIHFRIPCPYQFTFPAGNLLPQRIPPGSHSQEIFTSWVCSYLCDTLPLLPEINSLGLIQA